MPSAKQTRNVALVGAKGTVGAPILSALLAASHKTTVLTRPDSSTNFPSDVTVHVGDYNDEEFALRGLNGQEVLILALGFNAYDAQIPLIKAAAKAGVSYIVPCEFGSDPTHQKLNAEIQLMNMKAPYRKLIEDLGVSWVGVTNNPWVEFSIRLGLYGIDLKKRTVAFYDEGNVKSNFTTLARVGETLAALFTLPEAELSKYKNEFVYFSSFYASQRDFLAGAMRATGTTEKDWTITNISTDKVIQDAKDPAADSRARMMLLFALVFKDGYGGDYNSKVVDYEKLGLAKEDLDTVMNSLAQEPDA
ncbi:hypothetical protein GGR58DRAFT_475224 [Xylaria digitata]|nr:hypothetical protein GGR58DRAFT_475224 [Xylaria digitata]